jgi:hypothetical protein
MIRHYFHLRPKKVNLYVAKATLLVLLSNFFEAKNMFDNEITIFCTTCEAF